MGGCVQRKAKVTYGDALYICGDCESLGNAELGKAIRMTHLDSDLWVVDVPKASAGDSCALLPFGSDHETSCTLWLTRRLLFFPANRSPRAQGTVTLSCVTQRTRPLRIRRPQTIMRHALSAHPLCPTGWLQRIRRDASSETWT